jgi:hypothetical protein
MPAVIRQITSLERFFPQIAGSSQRYYQPAPSYDLLDVPQNAERRSERPSNTHSVVNPMPTQDQLLQPKVKALLVDAAGTLLSPSEPAAEVRRKEFHLTEAVAISILSANNYS